MSKMRIFGEGRQFVDNYNLTTHSGIVGVKINGNCVQNIWKDGRTTDTFNAGQPIKKLVWGENGNVYAVCEDGSLKQATVLTHNPTKLGESYEYEVYQKNGKTYEGEEPTRTIKSERTTKIRYSGSKSSGWWWKWPLKGAWWLFKFVFFVAIFGNNDKK